MKVALLRFRNERHAMPPLPWPQSPLALLQLLLLSLNYLPRTPTYPLSQVRLLDVCGAFLFPPFLSVYEANDSLKLVRTLPVNLPFRFPWYPCADAHEP